MYKRPARILFIDPGEGARARIAQAWARELGTRWVEAGAAAMVAGESQPDLTRVLDERVVSGDTGPCPNWTQALEASWDLVVLLDFKGSEDLPARIRGVRVKSWNLADSCPAGADGSAIEAMDLCRDALRERVEGLLGGFRMKAREDDNQAGMTDDGNGP
ncbi:hypothetical protein [Thiohalorhabdus sp.]|uniref:hypothetical protein n=1 Tax=Thiohalorhabdus sp. TaxID=3094134 RepID=UPI002FC32B70